MTSLFASASALQFPKEPTIEGLLEALFQPVLQEFGDKNPPPTFRAGPWMRMMKRMHHKLLVVDGERLQGGGRNVEDPYHMETDALVALQKAMGQGTDGHPAFMDADFYLASKELGEEARAGFESYWTCLADGTGKLPSACKSKIPVTPVVAKADVDYTARIKAHEQRASELRERLAGFQVGPASLHDGTFQAKNAPVAYIENRMHPVRPMLAIEELSRYNAAWSNLMASTQAGEEILLHNAYLYFTPRVMKELASAVRRGVKVRIVTNSTISSPQGFVGHIAKTQFRYLMRLAEEQHPGKGLVKVYEYVTKPLSLHAKVSVFGEYAVIGATNADPRSELLDTQNGVVVGPNAAGGSLAADYRAWVDQLLKRQDSVKELTRSEVDEWVPAYDTSTSSCPELADQQKVMLCYVGHLVDISAESEDMTGKAARAFLNLAFIML
jgi:phosphatidylserine/phosphatidylglycerophosphate/cardiolipin synthase-like enzyme